MPFPLQPGAKFYFPNVVFRLLRSNLPPQQCVFRCPQQLNKIDIKSILTNLYDLSITDVRTMNYLGRTHKGRLGTRVRAANYKKVIVTMEEDFNFPPVPEAKLVTSGEGAIKLPPRASFGRNSANRIRHKIEEGRPKGLGPHLQKWKQEKKAEATKNAQ
ncbi:hypothetical protein PhCBS80983_g02606 [Powellomyces hirtus]|uniref:Large ribosomal subunit protein uL23m n=1 Tax=Powellomyces hirtus TaxID=109895 RepID=A0A507E7A1_9FUNG|nr:hypothetical protein PhCBS80983_g02606 [Powellomyces hirtus]